jgi:hypothetical protein
MTFTPYFELEFRSHHRLGRAALPASMTTPSFSLGISPAHSYTSTCKCSGLFPLR